MSFKTWISLSLCAGTWWVRRCSSHTDTGPGLGCDKGMLLDSGTRYRTWLQRDGMPQRSEVECWRGAGGGLEAWGWRRPGGGGSEGWVIPEKLGAKSAKHRDLLFSVLNDRHICTCLHLKCVASLHSNLNKNCNTFTLSLNRCPTRTSSRGWSLSFWGKETLARDGSSF